MPHRTLTTALVKMKTLNRKGGASDEVIAHFLRIKLIHHISSMHIHESMYKTYLEYNGKFFANVLFSQMQRQHLISLKEKLISCLKMTRAI